MGAHSALGGWWWHQPGCAGSMHCEWRVADDFECKARGHARRLVEALGPVMEDHAYGTSACIRSQWSLGCDSTELFTLVCCHVMILLTIVNACNSADYPLRQSQASHIHAAGECASYISRDIYMTAGASDVATRWE